MFDPIGYTTVQWISLITTPNIKIKSERFFSQTETDTWRVERYAADRGAELRSRAPRSPSLNSPRSDGRTSRPVEAHACFCLVGEF